MHPPSGGFRLPPWSSRSSLGQTALSGPEVVARMSGPTGILHELVYAPGLLKTMFNSVLAPNPSNVELGSGRFRRVVHRVPPPLGGPGKGPGGPVLDDSQRFPADSGETISFLRRRTLSCTAGLDQPNWAQSRANRTYPMSRNRASGP